MVDLVSCQDGSGAIGQQYLRQLSMVRLWWLMDGDEMDRPSTRMSNAVIQLTRGNRSDCRGRYGQH